MGVPAATVTIQMRDINGKETSRSFEARDAAVTDAQAVALADQLQALTQLEVVKVSVTRNVSGFTATAAETNSSISETASVTAEKTEGDKKTFNLPALKAAYKSGSNVIANHADMLAFLANFDDGGGVAASVGLFYVSDGEELSEVDLEAGKVEGKVNR